MVFLFFYEERICDVIGAFSKYLQHLCSGYSRLGIFFRCSTRLELSMSRELYLNVNHTKRMERKMQIPNDKLIELQRLLIIYIF